MARAFAGLLVFIAVAAAGCLASSDSYHAALLKSRRDMEKAGYDCISNVGVRERRVDASSVNPFTVKAGDVLDFGRASQSIEDLWAARGWGEPEQAESIAFLEDGTMCVRKKGASTSDPALGGRKLFLHSVDVPETQSPGGSRTGAPRLLKQELSFEPELPIPEGVDEVRVPGDKSLEPPFSLVGNVGETCTGILVGPCHYLTAAHCVFDHKTFQVIGNTGFNPGRNGVESLFPLGRFQALRVFPSKNWTMRGDRKYDAAIVQVQGRPGDEIGSIDFGAEGLPAVVGLNIAGYPGDKPLAQMWADFCDGVELNFGTGKKEFVFHDCNATKGNSGSPMWTYTPADGNRQVAAVFTSSTIQFLEDEDPPRFAAVQTSTFLEGDILKELQESLAGAECSDP